jgi:hypothetical protein
MGAIFFVVGSLHPGDGNVRRDALSQVKAVIRRFESAGTGPFPFVSVTEAFAHGPAYFGCFPRAYPDDRVDTGDIGELELIDTGFGIFRLFRRRVI